jgi:hypothetical protein
VDAAGANSEIAVEMSPGQNRQRYRARLLEKMREEHAELTRYALQNRWSNSSARRSESGAADRLGCRRVRDQHAILPQSLGFEQRTVGAAHGPLLSSSPPTRRCRR